MLHACRIAPAATVTLTAVYLASVTHAIVVAVHRGAPEASFFGLQFHENAEGHSAGGGGVYAEGKRQESWVGVTGALR